jgi:hypothetical protein
VAERKQQSGGARREKGSTAGQCAVPPKLCLFDTFPNRRRRRVCSLLSLQPVYCFSLKQAAPAPKRSDKTGDAPPQGFNFD